MQIRRADLADIEMLAPLFDAYRGFYGQPSDELGAARFLGERLAQAESVVLLAVDGSGGGLGFTQLYPLFSSVRMGRVWLLNDLFVAEGARRSGVADALMAAAEDFARADGAAGMQLETGDDNLGAQALYRRRGWILEQGFQHYGLTL